jgi:mannose-6-phosphate isomerase class I
MDALRLRGRALRTTEEQFQIYAVLEGGGALRWRERTYALTRGDVWLIPACVGEHALEPHGALLVVNLRCLG